MEFLFFTYGFCVLQPGSKKDHLERIRADIRDFKAARGLDKVVVLWTANTERFTDITPGLAPRFRTQFVFAFQSALPISFTTAFPSSTSFPPSSLGVNDTADNILRAIDAGAAEIAPSTVFAVAAILEGCTFINGSPQNTLVPGVVALALRHDVQVLNCTILFPQTPSNLPAHLRTMQVAGDDFKSGQTKIKSVLVDYLVSAGIKVSSIVSYNHLGNNDGKNLSAPEQFRSKEISKSNVVDDMVLSNGLL